MLWCLACPASVGWISICRQAEPCFSHSPLTANHSLLLSVTSQTWSHLLLSYRATSDNDAAGVNHKILVLIKSKDRTGKYLFLIVLPSCIHLSCLGLTWHPWVSFTALIAGTEVTLPGFSKRHKVTKQKSRSSFSDETSRGESAGCRVTQAGKLSVIVSRGPTCPSVMVRLCDCVQLSHRPDSQFHLAVEWCDNLSVLPMSWCWNTMQEQSVSYFLGKC